MIKGKKFYLIFLITLVLVVEILFAFNNKASEEELKVKAFYPSARKIKLMKDIGDDMFISVNFPGIKRAYEVDGELKAFVSTCIGYNGPIDVLVAIDSSTDKLLGIEILEHEESPIYARYIEYDWFLERFKDLGINKYLNLVILEKENPEDVIQVTGATISSQAVVNAVNAAIGAYQYKMKGVKMDAVADVVPQELLEKDSNSFAINWEGGSIRIDTDEIKEYEQKVMDVVLINTTGTETPMTVKGPTLRDILEKEGIDLSDYEGIGVTGRDGYYTMIDREKLESSDVILAWEVDGKPLKEDEKPIRVVLPSELGPYWVKMVSNIDLYDEISPKDIDKVHIFDYLVEDIEPYYYQYYGSKDKSYEVGKILRKFDVVDEKGFFTMASTDGLIKNETISMVKQRYYIKIEGDNAPMNIAPTIKLGMNVKNMTHFSTTKDAVIFPEKMVEVVRTKDIGGKEGLLLEDVLLTTGMRWNGGERFVVVGRNGLVQEITYDEMLKSYMVVNENQVNFYIEDNEIMRDIIRVEKK